MSRQGKGRMMMGNVGIRFLLEEGVVVGSLREAFLWRKMGGFGESRREERGGCFNNVLNFLCVCGSGE